MSIEKTQQSSFSSLKGVPGAYSGDTTVDVADFDGLSLLQTTTTVAFQEALNSTPDPLDHTTVFVLDSEARLSAEEQLNFFKHLQQSLQRGENIEHVFTFHQIQTALLRNPRMMRNMKKLQDVGAELVVAKVEDGVIEFADAAADLFVGAQEAVLATLTEPEKQAALEKILTFVKEDNQKEMLRGWLDKDLNRSQDTRGLNFAEALLFATVHDCSLIEFNLYAAMALKWSVYERTTWTWFDQDLFTVMSDGRALLGKREGTNVDSQHDTNNYRYYTWGARVAGLKLAIT